MKNKLKSTICCAIIAIAAVLTFTGCQKMGPFDPEFAVQTLKQLRFTPSGDSLERECIIAKFQDRNEIKTINVKNIESLALLKRYFDIEIDNDFLDFELAKSSDDTPQIKVFLKSDAVLPFVAKIIFTPKTSETKSYGEETREITLVAQESNVDDFIPGYVKSSLGMTMDINDGIMEFGHISMALDLSTFTAQELLIDEFAARTTAVEITGMKYEETCEAITESVELSVKNIPIKKEVGGGSLLKEATVTMSGSFEESWSKEEKSSNKHEYTVEIVKKTMATAHVDPTCFGLTREDTIAFLQTHMSDKINEALNTSGMDTTKEGICRLYDAYGSYFVTQADFGGIYFFLYGRKCNAYSEATSFSAGASLSTKFKENGGNAQGLAALLQVLAAAGASINTSGSEEKSYSEEQTGEISFIRTIGGGGSTDYAVWDASIADASSNLTICGYGGGTGHDGTLMPLYYLATNPDVRAAMERYLPDYIESLTIDQPRLILADFQMVKGNDDHQVLSKMQYEATGPDGQKKLLYNYMMANGDAITDNGHPIETSQDAYIVVGDVTDQYWVYALAYEDEVEGIIDVRFFQDDSEKPAEYTLRGDHAGDGMNWPAIDDHRVALKWASNDPSKPLITGVGLLHAKNGDTTKCSVVASSVGTEWMLALESSKSKERFNTYWSEEGRTYMLGASKKYIGDHWFGYNSAANNYRFLFPVFTTIDLPENLAYDDEGHITMPLNWNE